MSFKKVKVVMLSTNEKASSLSILNSGKLNYGAEAMSSTNTKLQHLYFLSNEEIKVGDWCIIKDHAYSKPIQVDKIIGSEVAFKTDKVIVLNQSLEDCNKIIATTDKSLMYLESDYSCYLPQIPQSFIEKFVEEYNKGNVITEVMVEYEPIGAYSNPKYDSDYRLKVNSKDNTITIRKIKDSWSREEVEKLCREARYTTGVVEVDK